MTSPAAARRIDAAACALHAASWVGDVEWPCCDSSHIDGTCTEWYRELASAALQAADRVGQVQTIGTRLDLVALRRTAEAATAGPWWVTEDLDDDPDGSAVGVACGPPDDSVMVAMTPGSARFDGATPRGQWEADAAHMAGWDPTTAISLLDRLRAAERALGGDQGTVHAGESVHIPALEEWISLATAMGVPECTDADCWHHEGVAS